MMTTLEQMSENYPKAYWALVNKITGISNNEPAPVEPSNIFNHYKEMNTKDIPQSCSASDATRELCGLKNMKIFKARMLS